MTKKVAKLRSEIKSLYLDVTGTTLPIKATKKSLKVLKVNGYIFSPLAGQIRQCVIDAMADSTQFYDDFDEKVRKSIKKLTKKKVSVCTS